MIKKIAVIGDSIVHGRVDQINGGWVTHLKLWFEKLKVGNGVYNLGITGNTTRDVYLRLQQEIGIRNIDLVILAIGVNDIRRLGPNGNLELSLDESRDYFKNILGTVLKLEMELIVISMFPLDEIRTTPYDEDGEYFFNKDQMNLHMVQKTICNELGIKIVDLFNLFKEIDLSSISYEGIHPNNEGHRRIFEIVKPTIVEACIF